MRYFLKPQACLKWLETPSIYHIESDELYELDESSFQFLQSCSSEKGSTSDDNDFLKYCMLEDILTTEPVALKRPLLMKSPTPSLRYIELQITDRCNLACRHCYIANTEHSELSLEKILTVLTEFEEMQGLRVLITGGEPLLHKDFDAINEMLPDFFLRKVLFSNGLLITKKLLNNLNVQEIQISIDGLQEGHDAVRGKGSFQKAINAVRLCLEKGFAVSISTMVHADNLKDFEAMDIFFRKMGVRDWTVDIPCVAGRLVDNQRLQLPPEIAGKYLKFGFGEGLHGGGEGYGCGLHLISVMAGGRAAKCTFYADRSVGTISDGLKECWRQITPVHLSDLSCDCSFLEACRGGCRYRAETLGNSLGKDLYRCHLYDIIKNK